MLNSSGTIDKYLIPIGIYGCAITIGLFIYELHGISVCKQIMRQAGHLEDSLNIPRYMGQYRDQNHNVLHRAIEVEMASWVVYLSVLAGWIYIAGSRGWWDRTSPGYFTNPIWIAGIVVGIVLMKWIYAVFAESKVQRKSENRSVIEQLAAGLFLRCMDHPAGHEPGWRPDDEAHGASPVPASASLTAPGVTSHGCLVS